jgi:uncharacterized protein YecT (DUF1311 family)
MRAHGPNLNGDALRTRARISRSVATIVTVSSAALLISVLVPVAQIPGQTQAAMNAQTREEFVRAAAELNRTYEALLAKLRDAQGKAELRQSQRAWLAFRDAEAAFGAGQARGGSMASQTPLRNYDGAQQRINT